MSTERKLSHIALSIGFWSCFIGAIWYPQDAIKWIATSGYLYFVGRNFGLTMTNEKIVGSKIIRARTHLTNFLPMRKR